MKYLPLLLIAVSVIACKEKRKCDFVMPEGYELVMNSDSAYSIRHTDGLGMHDYLGADAFFNIRLWYSFPDNVRRFSDSCEAKGYLSRYLDQPHINGVQKLKNEFKPVSK